MPEYEDYVDPIPKSTRYEIIRAEDNPVVNKSEEELARQVAARTALIETWQKAPTVRSTTGVSVFGKRVAKSTARKLAGLAAETLLEHFSVFEVARVLQDESYSMEAYMRTLKEIRDSPEATPRDRMAAGEKIMDLVLTILKSNLNAGGSDEGPLSNIPQESISRASVQQNLTQVLIGVQGSMDHLASQGELINGPSGKLPENPEDPTVGGTECGS